MLSILSVTLPIFLLIGVGYLTTRAGLFTADHIRGLGLFVIDFALPALIFQALVSRPLRDIFDGSFLAVYGIGSLAAFLVMFASFRFGARRNVTASALRGLGVSGSNSGFIGYPVAAQVLGPPAAIALALCAMIENLLILPLTLALADSGTGEHMSRRQIAAHVFGNLVRSPLIIAIVAGTLFAVVGLTLPGPVARAVGMVAAASAPVALVVIGGTLVGLELRGIAGEVALVAAGKLLLHPLAVLVAMQFVPIADPTLRTAAVLFASIPMLSIYPILGQRYGEGPFCAAALLAATTSSFVTVSGVLWLLQHGWLV